VRRWGITSLGCRGLVENLRRGIHKGGCVVGAVQILVVLYIMDIMGKCGWMVGSVQA
jgi:hypothetical protein